MSSQFPIGILAGEVPLNGAPFVVAALLPGGDFTLQEPAGAELRAVVGARVRGPGVSAYLLAGSVSADLYAERDAALRAANAEGVSKAPSERIGDLAR